MKSKTKSFKLKLFAVAALLVALIASLGALLGINLASADRNVSVTGASTTLFSASGKAEVWAHTVEGATAEENEYYTMFVFKENGDAISYKKNLAYKWFYNTTPATESEDGETQEETLTKGEGYFNMEFGFELGAEEKLDFENFFLTFEGQEYSQTKDGKSVNYIVLKPTDDGKHINVIITDDNSEENLTAADGSAALSADKIKIEFTAKTADEYAVAVSDGTNSVTSAFKNVGGNYAKYSSSSTTPVVPMVFSAEYKETEDGDSSESAENSYTRMALYSLNGQSFSLTGVSDNEGHKTGGSVNDVTPPVLCLDKEVTFIKGGSEISFSYTAIDVLTSSASAKTSYFLLSKQQAADDAFNPEDISADGLYTEVTSGDSQKLIYDVNTYVPKSGEYNTSVYNEDFDVSMALKICLTLTDTTSNGVSCNVLLDWYVDDEYLLTIGNHKYIAVGKDEVGATFGYVTETDGTVTCDPDAQVWQDAVAAYQAKVTEAAEEQQLKAGNKNYFYLPSVESLLSDNATKYQDLTFNLYYMYEGSNTFQSSTGKAANSLSINLSKAGKYTFTLLATDAANNKMYYYKQDADGELEKVEFGTGTSDILNFYNEDDESEYAGMKKYLPWFDFYVGSSELSIEDPGEQKTAYVGNTYSTATFTINGVSHNETYNLYLFRNDLFFADNGYVMDYEYFMAHKAELLEGRVEDFKDESGKYIDCRKWFNEITDDDIYEDYNWNGKDSFIPQVGNAYYLVKCTAEDSDNSNRSVTGYMGILAAPQVRALEGEDVWLQNNLTSVILLCVAGVSLVGIILLLVIKPKNKGDVDEEFEIVERKSKTSKSKKK